MLNVVAKSDGWVLGWVADKLARGLGCEQREGAVQNGTNIYVPYYFLHQKTSRDIALFTHYSVPEIWDQAVSLADVCVAMSHKTAEYLPAEKTVVLEIPPDPQFRKDKIVLGVSGRDYAQYGDQRKRTRWIEKIRRMPGVEIRFTGGNLKWEEMPDWYRGIDYLLVTSDNEGGPMGVVEAIAAGKPVIAPNVGWAWDYPVIRYEDWGDLEKTICKLIPRPDEWGMFVEKVRAICSPS